MTNAKDKLIKKIGFVSLGCDKNRVDTENIITSLCQNDFEVVSDETAAEVIVINTCAFLASARKEAAEIITEMAAHKKNKLEKLIVAGCLPMTETEKDLKQKFPEVDAYIKPTEINNIVKVIYNLYNEKPITKNIIKTYRKLTTPSHYAYLKIADGCNNGCAYCKIPGIRGKYISTPIENLVSEATILANQGVKELILVAQDCTRYGTDLYKKAMLVDLLQQLSKIEGIKWIRIHYCYPEMITPDLINEIKNNQKIVKYLDIPFQHISTNILKAMNRRSNEQSIRYIIEELRRHIPEIAIRTTFMVGFPGETKKDFKKLCNFLKEYKLTNVGFFAYSREEGTPSYNYPSQIKEKVKEKRLKKVQQLQAKISDKSCNKIGKCFNVICDSIDNSEESLYIGRDYSMSPDIDFNILFESETPLKIGNFYTVKILTDINDSFYTFYGEVVENKGEKI